MNEPKVSFHIADINYIRLFLSWLVGDFEMEPVLMAVSIGIDPQVEVVLIFAYFAHDF